MRDLVEIGMGKTARRTYELSDINIVPSRRTRSSKDVSTAWQLDAYRFEIPVVAHPTDAIVSPEFAIELGRLGRPQASSIVQELSPSTISTSISRVTAVSTAMPSEQYLSPIRRCFFMLEHAAGRVRSTSAAIIPCGVRASGRAATTRRNSASGSCLFCILCRQ